MPATTILKSVIKVAHVIYKQVQTAKVNSHQARSLARRIRIIVDALDGLDKVKDKAHYERGLRKFEALLHEISEFISQFSDKHKLKRFLLAKNYKGIFHHFNDELEVSRGDLTLELNIQQIMNREVDLAEERLDLAHIEENYNILLAECEAIREGVEDVQQQLGDLRRRSLAHDREVDARLASIRRHVIAGQADSGGAAGAAAAGGPGFFAHGVGAGAGAAAAGGLDCVVHGAGAGAVDTGPRYDVDIASRPKAITAESLYLNGVEHEHAGNIAEAMRCFQAAADQEYYKACTRMGIFYLHGKHGLTQDKAHAGKLLEIGVAKNHPRALHTLGQMLEYADGVDPNLARAQILYQRLRDHADSTAEQREFAEARLVRVAEKLAEARSPMR